jgi:signal transduction histidine kinase
MATILLRKAQLAIPPLRNFGTPLVARREMTHEEPRIGPAASTIAPRLSYRLAALLALACVVPAVLDGLQTYAKGTMGGGRPDWAWVVFQSTEWLIFGALTPLTFYLGRRLPLRSPHLRRNIAIHFLGALILCVLWASAGTALQWMLGIRVAQGSRPVVFLSWLLTSLPWSVFMYFAVLGTVHGIYALLEAREREAQASRLNAQLAEAKLQALRMQLDPHFLFNSLNGVTVLLRDGEITIAAAMLEMLSDVLRQVLRSDRTHEVPLSEEIQLTERYLAIESMRFSDRLRPTFDVDPALTGVPVPGLLLQPLVENAVRHGIAKRTNAGMLLIRGRRDGSNLVLTVEDDGEGLSPNEMREGVGLRNIRERLATLYGHRASVVLTPRAGGGTVATVMLPCAPTSAASPAHGEQ